MKVVRGDLDASEVLVGDLNRGVVRVGVERGFHEEASARGGRGDQIDDGLMADEGFAPPVLRDETEQPMLDLVPFARARGKVADRQCQAQLVGQSL